MTTDRSRFRRWWEGEYIPYENWPDSVLITIGGWYKRHWTSEAAHALVDFWLKYWQWIIGTALAVLAIIFA